jgi:hypothetical protein
MGAPAGPRRGGGSRGLRRHRSPSSLCRPTLERPAPLLDGL